MRGPQAWAFGWHDLRHTHGSHLAMRGVPLKAIQELMGHADMSETMRYAHLSPETRANAVQQLDPPSPLPLVASAPATEGAPGGHMTFAAGVECTTTH
ncbi:tyrosine-type recombinase/integrase [Myxococcus sp. CA039A]|nr:tyrosine-type recombinase/integrase [Myxococcus sp. CA039A]